MDTLRSYNFYEMLGHVFSGKLFSKYNSQGILWIIKNILFTSTSFTSEFRFNLEYSPIYVFYESQLALKQYDLRNMT